MSLPEYQGQFYISAEGISREVITTDICRYLGNNARIRPNMDANGRIIGYWYSAYRALTDPMVRSLQEDSARWQKEKVRNSIQGVSGTYEGSDSRPPHTYQPNPPIQTPIVPTPMQSYPSQPAPPMVPPHEKLDGPDSERYVYDSQGRRYYDLKYKTYLFQPPPAPSEEPSKSYPTEPPAPNPPPSFWTVDPVSGRGYYVVNGRAQWAP